MRKSISRKESALIFADISYVPKGCNLPYFIEIDPMVLEKIFNSLHCNRIMSRCHYI